MPFSIGDSVQAVFFDAVGTLLIPDPPAPLAYAAAARRQGIEVPTEEIGTRFVAAFRAEEAGDRAAGWVTNEQREIARWQRIVAHTLPELPDPARGFAELFEYFAQPQAWRVESNAPALIQQLRDRGVILGIGSNYDERLNTVIAGHPVLELFCGRVVVSATVGFRKPAGEFFAEMVRVARCDPAHVLFVGDDYSNDYVGATAAGVPAVLIDPTGRHPSVPHRITHLGELQNPAPDTELRVDQP